MGSSSALPRRLDRNLTGTLDPVGFQLAAEGRLPMVGGAEVLTDALMKQSSLSAAGGGSGGGGDDVTAALALSYGAQAQAAPRALGSASGRSFGAHATAFASMASLGGEAGADEPPPPPPPSELAAVCSGGGAARSTPRPSNAMLASQDTLVDALTGRGPDHREEADPASGLGVSPCSSEGGAAAASPTAAPADAAPVACDACQAAARAAPSPSGAAAAPRPGGAIGPAWGAQGGGAGAGVRGASWMCPPFAVKASCGKRKEMEDAYTLCPNICQLPLSPGSDGRVADKLPRRIALQFEAGACVYALPTHHSAPAASAGVPAAPAAPAPSPPDPVPPVLASTPEGDEALDAAAATAAAAEADEEGEGVDRMHFFAVYDGHGGMQASQHCSKRLHYHLCRALNALLGEGLVMACTDAAEPAAAGGDAIAAQVAADPAAGVAAPAPAAAAPGGDAGVDGAAAAPEAAAAAGEATAMDARASASDGDGARAVPAPPGRAALRSDSGASHRSGDGCVAMSPTSPDDSWESCDLPLTEAAAAEGSVAEGSAGAGGGSNSGSSESMGCPYAPKLEEALRESFLLTDEEFSKDGTSMMVGSTAVVALVSSRRVWIANCGDSRAVLSRGGVAYQVTDDHKPEREDEAERVEKLGGQVLYWNGHRVMGVLAMSRAIGDRNLRPFVIPEPELSVINRHPSDEMLLLASDGLWDVMDNQEAMELALRSAGRARAKGASRKAAARVACTVLTKAALDRGSRDNITIVIIDLAPPCAAGGRCVNGGKCGNSRAAAVCGGAAAPGGALRNGSGGGGGGAAVALHPSPHSAPVPDTASAALREALRPPSLAAAPPLPPRSAAPDAAAPPPPHSAPRPVPLPGAGPLQRQPSSSSPFSAFAEPLLPEEAEEEEAPAPAPDGSPPGGGNVGLAAAGGPPPTTPPAAAAAPPGDGGAQGGGGGARGAYGALDCAGPFAVAQADFPGGGAPGGAGLPPPPSSLPHAGGGGARQ